MGGSHHGLGVSSVGCLSVVSDWITHMSQNSKIKEERIRLERAYMDAHSRYIRDPTEKNRKRMDETAKDVNEYYQSHVTEQ